MRRAAQRAVHLKGVNAGVYAHPAQRPSQLLPGLLACAWHDPQQHAALRALLTAKLPRVPRVCNELLVTLELKVLKVSKAAFELTVNPDNPDPLPTKNPAVIVAGVVTLPVTHS